MGGFFAGGRVESGSGEFAELMEDGLGGVFVANICSNAVGVEEMGEAGEEARAGDFRKDIGGGGGFRRGVVGGRAAADLGFGGRKGGGEFCGILEEGEVAVVVWEGAVGLGRKA